MNNKQIFTAHMNGKCIPLANVREKNAAQVGPLSSLKPEYNDCCVC